MKYQAIELYRQKKSSTNVEIHFSWILGNPRLHIPEENGVTALRNVWNYLQFDMLQCPLRLQVFSTPLREALILLYLLSFCLVLASLKTILTGF